MPPDVLVDLARDLRVPVEAVAFLEAADADTLVALHEAVRRAHVRQERELAAAFEGTVTVVPRPLRGRVRKLLTGG